jgi:hypothetical protein
LHAHSFSLPRQWHVPASAEKSALDFLEWFPWSATVCLTAAHEEAAGKLFTVAASDVERAASLLFTLVQDSLRWMREFGHGSAAEESLLALSVVQVLAVEAVAAVCPGAHRTAKRLQRKAADGGEPLTVCVGDLQPTLLPDDLRDVLDPYGEVDEDEIPRISWNTRGNGCGVICVDSTGRAHFRRWCQTCSDSSTARREAKVTAIAKAWSGDPSGLTWIEGRRVRIWPRSCSVCGQHFKTDRANKYRCDKCRAGHRARRPAGSAMRTFLG